MSFYNGNENYDQAIMNQFVALSHNEQLIICTDIQYGSVNQLFVKEALKFRDKNILIVSGVNLPLLLEIVTTPGIIPKNDLDVMILKAKKQIVQVDFNELLSKVTEEEFF